MAEDKKKVSVRGEGPGCAFGCGSFCMAVAAGSIWGSAYGWLVFGACMIVLGIAACFTPVVTIRSEGQDERD